MVKITVNDAIKRLMDSHPGLYADLVADLSDEDVKIKSVAYESHGAILLKTLWYGTELKYMWHICDIGNSDMTAALNDLMEKEKENAEFDRLMIYAKELEGINSLVFSSTGKAYVEEKIRILTERDKEYLKSLTAVPDDDSEFAKSILTNMVANFSDMESDPTICMLGIFAGDTLIGAVSIKIKCCSEIIVISNVFVSREYRGCGYSIRLLRAAMSLYPNARYIYSCGTDNYASIASAKAAGFVFEGTYMF